MDNKEKKNPYIRGAAAGLGAGALAYLFSRKPWIKGHLYEVIPSNWSQRLRGSIRRVTREQLKEFDLTPNDVIYGNYPARFNIDEYSISKKKLGGAAKINLQKKLIHLMDKADTYKKLPHYSKSLPSLYKSPSRRKLKKILELTESKRLNEGVEMFNREVQKKNRLPEGTQLFIKERGGYGSRGVFFPAGVPQGAKKARSTAQYIYDKASGKTQSLSPTKQWKEYLASPKSYIIQSMAPKGREFRVITHNGDIVGVFDRHGMKGAVTGKGGLSKKQMSGLSEYAKKIEKGMKQDLKQKGETYFGHDIIVPQDKKLPFQLIETNTQEGYYNRYPNMLYRSAFNRDIASVAAGKAALIGAPVGAGTAMYAKIKNKNK